MSPTSPSLSLLAHPYRSLRPVTGGRDEIRSAGRRPGSAVIWMMRPGSGGDDLVFGRPGGLALIVILPEADEVMSSPNLLQRINRCRPQGILPNHLDPAPHNLAQVLRRPPNDLAAEVTDYLTWRGLVVDRDTVHLIRRIIEHSGDLTSVTALSKSMYLSRRALGRRLMSRGLPVPSHWLQLGRLLRLAIRLQNSDASVFSIACDAGYPDGFSVSNQMQRLIGYRPSQVREYLGWEWLLEEWLRREAEMGGLAPATAEKLDLAGVEEGPTPLVPAKVGRPRRPRNAASTEPTDS